MKARNILLGVVFSVLCASPAFALYLPAPGGTIDGVYYSIPYDDFWSYSNQILMSIQKNSSFLPESTWGAYDFATGTGGLDVILYTGAGTNDRNKNSGPDGPDADSKGDFFFEDPVGAPTGGETSISGWWGQDDQLNDGSITDVNGPVTVGYVLDYLHALNPLNNIPVFYMDMNQIGGEEAGQTFTFNGQVLLIDPSDGSTQHVWAFDNTNQPGGGIGSGLLADGDFDPASTITPIAEIPTLVGDSGTDYGPINHNLGSGKADFIAFAPSMDLSLFDPDWWFVVQFNMTNLNDGFEEIFLTGLISVPPPPIPEPSTFVLLGVGLLGLGYCARRKSRR